MTTDLEKREKLYDIAMELLQEAYKATNRYPKFNSEHEGYAVLLEEVDELWREVMKSPKNREPQKLRAEAVQVGAMALRFLYDRCPQK